MDHRPASWSGFRSSQTFGPWGALLVVALVLAASVRGQSTSADKGGLTEYAHAHHSHVYDMQRNAFLLHHTNKVESDAAAMAPPPLEVAGTTQRVSSAASGSPIAASLGTTPGEIRIATVFATSVTSGNLSASQITLVRSSVATAVLVLRKYYKVNQPWITPLILPSSPAAARICYTGCNPVTDGFCPAGTTYPVPAQLTNGSGQANTDLMIVVMANSGDQCTNTVAWAFSCFFDPTTDRPIVGYVNVCPLFFSDAQFSQPLGTRAATIVHEVTHALGFTDYFFWRGGAGSNTTATDAYGSSVVYMTSARLKALTRSFFNCPTAVGAQIEEQGGSGSAGSHWDYRLFWGEMMAPSGGYLLSNFTLSVMADLGWYSPRFFFAGPFVRAKNAGCDFLTQTGPAYASSYPDNELYCGTSSMGNSCSDDYNRARCSGANYVFNKPTTFQVAVNRGPSANDDCRVGVTPTYSFEVVSGQSMCYKTSLTTGSGSGVVGGCFKSQCTDGSLFIVAQAANGAVINVPCPSGAQVDLQAAASAVYASSSNSQYTAMSVVCPNNAAVCSSTTCTPACNTTNGQCINGNCVCYIEWLGIDCNLHVSQVSGSFDSYSPMQPPSPPPLVYPPPALSPPPPPPYPFLSSTKAQIQLTLSILFNTNYTALQTTATRKRMLLAGGLTLATFEADLEAAVEGGVRLAQGSVNVTSLTGSDKVLTARFTVLPAKTTEADGRAVVKDLLADPYTVLGAAFDAKYSITGATATYESARIVILTPAAPSKNFFPMAIVIGASVGGIVVVALLVGLICWCTRTPPNKVSPGQDTQNLSPGTRTAVPVYGGGQGPPGGYPPQVHMPPTSPPVYMPQQPYRSM